MRLIDADAVIEEQRRIMETLYGGSVQTLKEHMGIDDELSIPIHVMESYSRAKQFFFGLKGILEKSQAVDAVQVVRCRDCESSIDYCGYLVCSLSARSSNPKSNYIVNPDFFCARGKRKESI